MQQKASKIRFTQLVFFVYKNRNLPPYLTNDRNAVMKVAWIPELSE
jgi:hypothetical protein